MSEYDVSARSSVPPSVIWELLLDARTWPAWTPIDEFVLDRSSGVGDDGAATEVGSVRFFRTGEVVSGERVTDLVEERRFAYEDAVNDALSGYRASVELTPVDGGTAIRWRGTYTPRPDVAAVLPAFLQDFMGRMVAGLARYAEGRAGADDASRR